jgi:hypothetical protein
VAATDPITQRSPRVRDAPHAREHATRLGAGVVRRSGDRCYHIAGLTTQIAVGRRYPLQGGRTHVIASPEAKLTASWARIEVDSIVIRVPNIALHALGGFGVRHCL